MRAKKVLCLLMCVCMFVSFFADIAYVSAADKIDYDKIEWLYKVTVRVSKKRDSNCGNGKVKVNFEFEDFDAQVTLNNTNQKGGDATAEYTTKLAPWMLNQVVFENKTKDGFKMLKIDVTVEAKGLGRGSKSLASEYPNGSGDSDGVWIQTDDGDYPFYYVPIYLNRKVTGNGNFSELSDNLYIDPFEESTADIPYIYNGIVKDQYAKYITGGDTYECFKLSDPPKYSYTVTAEKYVNESTSFALSAKEFEQAGAIVPAENKYGFILNREKMRVFMNQNNLNRVLVTANLIFPARSAFGENRKSKSGLEIRRKAFSLDTSSVKFSNNFYTSSKDNYYYNKSIKKDGVNKITVNASVKINNSYFQIFGDDRKIDGCTMKFDNAYLELGNTGKKLYSDKKSVVFSGRDFKLDFPYEDGCDSENGGLKLVIENARFTPVFYNTDFYLWDEVLKDGCIDKSAKKIICRIDKLTHKVDAKTPEIAVETSDGSKVTDWHKELKLSAVPSEKIRADAEDNSGVYDNLAVMSLYSSDNKRVKIYNSRGENTSYEPAAYIQTLPMAAKSKTDIVLKLYDKTEGEYTLKILGSDIAGNTFTKTIEGIHLDNKPPVAQLTQAVSQNDGSATFNVTLTDASGTAKLYYAFTDGSVQMPRPGEDNAQKAGSGYIDSLINKWAFIDQSDTENGGAAIHVQVEKGKRFGGSLIYIAEDKFGNYTNMNFINIDIDNEDSDCKIVALDGEDKPLSSRKIAINANSNNKIYYAWEKPAIKGESGGYSTPYMPYTGVIDTALDAETAKFDGTYTIKAMVETPSGKKYYSQKQLAFDNSAPSINTSLLTPDTYAASQTVSVYATDISGVKEGYAQIVNADGSIIDGFDEFKLDVTDEMISQNINVGNIESGAYAINVRITDTNGIEGTATTPVFYIRNKAIESRVNVTSNLEIYNKPLADKGAFNIEISAGEKFKNADASQKQALYYRVSDNPDVYGAWVKGTDMTAEGDGFTAQFTVDGTDISLVDGLNTLYVQTAVFTDGGNTEQININNVSTNQIEVYGDCAAPVAYIIKDDIHTAQSIEAKLYAEDNLGGLTAECDDPNVQIKKTENSEGEYDITILENVDTVIRVKDAAGNICEVPLVINGIDKTAPETEIVSTEQKQAGARLDSYVTLKVKDVKNKGVKFGFIPQSERGGAVTDGKVADKYFENYNDEIITVNLTRSDIGIWENEYNETYQIRLAGATGTYYIAVRAEDSVENTCDIIIDDAPLTAENAELEYSYDVSPRLAGTKAAVKLKFNIPVFVLDQSLVTDKVDPSFLDNTIEETNLEIAKRIANNFTLEHTFVISRNGDHTLYTVDDIGRKKAITLSIGEDLVEFGKLKGLTAVTKVPDENGGMRELKDGEMANNDYSAIVEISPVDSDLRVMNIADSESGLVFDADKSEPYKDTVGYTKLIYNVGENSMVNEEGYWIGAVQSNERILNVNVLYKDETNPDMWNTSMVVIDNIDNTYPEYKITTSPEIYTLDENGNIDSIIYTPTKVVVTAVMQDKDSGIVKIRPGTAMSNMISGDDGGEPNYYEFKEIPLTDEDGNPIDYIENPWREDASSAGLPVSVEYFGDTNLKGEKRLVFTFTDNCFVRGTICTSGAGSEAFIMMPSHFSDNECVTTYDSIYKMPIEENTDYTVKYYMCGTDGIWTEMETKDAYCSKAKAVIEIAPGSRGEDRGLFVKNNGGSFEKILNNRESSYTFELRDKYGYTKDVEVSVTNFDTTAPVIGYTLANTAKTNAPYDVIITADDSESGIQNVILTSAGTEIPLTQTAEGYTGKISKNGAYSIIAYDKTGNRSSVNFSVANINTNQPEIANRIYSTPKEEGKTTSKSVSVTYVFKQPNVRIKKVEPLEGFDESNYSVNYSSLQVTFNKSGTLGIYFEDEYGNELRVPETIDYIDTTPPQLDAVAAVNESKTLVSVTFKKSVDPVTEKELDTRRDMHDIMISYGGMIQRADEAKYDFYENGYYTFKIYDDEGLTSNITLQITDIDTAAPKITEIKWSYESDVFQDGKWSDTAQTNVKSITPNGKAGYRAARDLNPVTNKDVTVTVTTDSPTRLLGSDDKYANTFTKTYTDNGMFIFNMQKNNLLTDVFGVDIQFIDKTPPKIDLMGKDELTYYENTNMGSVYNPDDIIKRGVAFEASDNITKADKLNVEVIDWGGFDYTDINNNVFNSSNPYTITYSVSDEAHNAAVAKRTIRLVGMYDTVAFVNGKLPDFTGRSDVRGDSVAIELKNFPADGIAYVRYKEGVKTMGEMKTGGTQVAKDENGVFTASGLKPGWYTFFIQTDRRDYFTLLVYVYE